MRLFTSPSTIVLRPEISATSQLVVFLFFFI
jgi:hypothetical protein